MQGEDDGTSVVPVSSWLASREGAVVPGVYAVYDAAQALQLVSYSRNVVLSLRGHVVRAAAHSPSHLSLSFAHAP